MLEITGFKHGDKKSYQLIFDQFYHRLCGYGYHYLKQSDEAEDIVQEVFLNLWDQKAGFNHINAVKAYLFTSVRNKCLNLLKHKGVQKAHEPNIIYEMENNSDLQIIEEDYYGRLYKEIDELPAAVQKIMALVLLGKKNREIAAELNISENTVKTQKKIAYARLKENLSPPIYSLLLSF